MQGRWYLRNQFKSEKIANTNMVMLPINNSGVTRSALILLHLHCRDPIHLQDVIVCGVSFHFDR